MRSGGFCLKTKGQKSEGDGAEEGFVGVRTSGSVHVVRMSSAQCTLRPLHQKMAAAVENVVKV